MSAERQEQARTFTVYGRPGDGYSLSRPSGDLTTLPGFETVELVERAPFEERVRRDQTDRIVKALRDEAAREPKGWRERLSPAGGLDRLNWLSYAADFIESLPVSPGPEEGER